MTRSVGLVLGIAFVLAIPLIINWSLRSLGFDVPFTWQSYFAGHALWTLFYFLAYVAAEDGAKKAIQKEAYQKAQQANAGRQPEVDRMN